MECCKHCKHSEEVEGQLSCLNEFADDWGCAVCTSHTCSYFEDKSILQSQELVCSAISELLSIVSELPKAVSADSAAAVQVSTAIRLMKQAKRELHKATRIKSQEGQTVE